MTWSLAAENYADWNKKWRKKVCESLDEDFSRLHALAANFSDRKVERKDETESSNGHLHQNGMLCWVTTMRNDLGEKLNSKQNPFCQIGAAPMFVNVIGFLKCGFKMLCLLLGFSAKRKCLLPWKQWCRKEVKFGGQWTLKMWRDEYWLSSHIFFVQFNLSFRQFTAKNKDLLFYFHMKEDELIISFKAFAIHSLSWFF